MPKPRDVETAELHLKLRKDLVEQVNKYRHNMEIDTKTQAWERLIEHALKNPPPTGDTA